MMLLLLLLVNLLKLLLLAVRSRGRRERVLLTPAQTDLVAEGRRGRSGRRGRRRDSAVDGSRSDRVVDVEPGPFGHRLHVMLLLVVGDLMLRGGDDGLDGVVVRRRRRSGRSDVHRFVLVLEGGRGGREQVGLLDELEREALLRVDVDVVVKVGNLEKEENCLISNMYPIFQIL